MKALNMINESQINPAKILKEFLSLAKGGNKQAQFEIYRFLLSNNLVAKFHKQYGYFTN